MARIVLERRKEEYIGDIDTESISRSVFVTGLDPAIMPEDCVIHFQRCKNGGGDIERVILSEKGTAVITFDDPKGEMKFNVSGKIAT